MDKTKEAVGEEKSMHNQNPNDEAATQDIVDYFYQNFQPFLTRPSKQVEAEVEDFIEQMDLHPGTLHMCYYKFPWLQGNLEDPEWLGSTEMLNKSNLSFLTEPEEPFLVLGQVLLEATFDKALAKKNEYVFALKVMVGDKIGYCPIPADIMRPGDAQQFKTMFARIHTT